MTKKSVKPGGRIPLLNTFEVPVLGNLSNENNHAR